MQTVGTSFLREALMVYARTRNPNLSSYAHDIIVAYTPYFMFQCNCADRQDVASACTYVALPPCSSTNLSCLCMTYLYLHLLPLLQCSLLLLQLLARGSSTQTYLAGVSFGSMACNLATLVMGLKRRNTRRMSTPFGLRWARWAESLSTCCYRAMQQEVHFLMRLYGSLNCMVRKQFQWHSLATAWCHWKKTWDANLEITETW